MALTFKTADLLKLITDITDAAAAEDERYTAACAEARAQYMLDWYTDHVDDVRALRDYLSKCLKAGTVPRHDKAVQVAPRLKAGRYDAAIQLFVGGGDGGVIKTAAGYYRVDELAGIAAILRAHQLDTITAYQLKELGTHPRDLQKLFSVASVAGVAVSS